MARPTAEALLSDPSVSYWLKDAIRTLQQRDRCDAARDAELLALAMSTPDALGELAALAGASARRSIEPALVEELEWAVREGNVGPRTHALLVNLRDRLADAPPARLERCHAQ